MLVPFNEIPGNARVWIFQSSALLDESQISELKRLSESFVEGWTAHHRELKAAFTVVDNMFLVFSVDESLTGASGYSIDKLHQFVKGREQAMQIQLLNRLLVALHTMDGPAVFRLSDAADKIEKGELDPQQLVYDCTVTSKSAFDNHFVTPLSSTWLSRYLPS